MKPEIVRMPLMYEDEQRKKVGVRINKYSLAGWLIGLLVLARFLNLGIIWFSVQGEITHNLAAPGPSTRTPDVNYIFLHFSNPKGAAESLAQEARTDSSQPGVRVAVYFNLLHPAKFMVQNLNANGLAPVDLGPVIVMVPPGTSQYFLTLWDAVGQSNGKRKGYRSSIIGELLFPSGKAPGISFTVKAPASSWYVMLPYLLYFFLPLLIILVLGFQNSRAVWAAFIYYPIAALLFDFKLLFFLAPYYGLIKITHQSAFFNSLEPVLAPLTALLLTCLGILGILKYKERRENFKETLIIAFFLLLPLIFRL